MYIAAGAPAHTTQVKGGYLESFRSGKTIGVYVRIQDPLPPLLRLPVRLLILPLLSQVLYLYDNHVESLKGLEMLRHLEQLYVDNNLLTTIEGVLPCRRLTKL